MDLQHAFEILEIDENASPKDIKQAYRDLASIWHPDRYTQNPRLHQKALDRMKNLNAAYDCIRSGYDEQIIISCPNCGTKNRIRSYTQEMIIKCRKCGFNLFSYQDRSERNDWGERILD